MREDGYPDSLKGASKAGGGTARPASHWLGQSVWEEGTLFGFFSSCVS